MKRLRSIVQVVLACAAMGALPAVVQAIFGRIRPRDFAISVLCGFVYATCIALPCWAVFPALRCRLGNRRGVARFAAFVLLLTVFAVGGCALANVILMSVGLVRSDRFLFTFWWSLRICLMITFTVGALCSVIVTLKKELQSAREELQEREIAEERERKIAAEARFASLESRVRPHFLFNTLNSISALVREDPSEAERMIERLAALLRFTLDSEHAGVVTLAEELRIVRDYLEIERVRFGVRLRYSIEADDAALGHSVPALSVQTLVENSVKHAVGSSTQAVEIQVRASVGGGYLLVEVGDNGPGFEHALSVKPGHGLDLLRRRLAGLFGASAALEVDGTAGRTRVAMRVPV